ncbi:hypothetical protein [Nostoc sp.]
MYRAFANGQIAAAAMLHSQK